MKKAIAPFGTNFSGCSLIRSSGSSKGFVEIVGSMRLIIDVQNYSAANDTNMTFGIGEDD